jgi:hypothetical protein
VVPRCWWLSVVGRGTNEGIARIGYVSAISGRRRALVGVKAGLRGEGHSWNQGWREIVDFVLRDRHLIWEAQLAFQSRPYFEVVILVSLAVMFFVDSGAGRYWCAIHRRSSAEDCAQRGAR